MKTLKHLPLCVAGTGLVLMLPSAFAQGFLDDSKASLELRNFYMNRDFRDGSGPVSYTHLTLPTTPYV